MGSIVNSVWPGSPGWLWVGGRVWGSGSSRGPRVRRQFVVLCSDSSSDAIQAATHPAPRENPYLSRGRARASGDGVTMKHSLTLAAAVLRAHWVREVAFAEDLSQVRTGAAPQVMASLRTW